jgi:hypothetical protein
MYFPKVLGPVREVIRVWINYIMKSFKKRLIYYYGGKIRKYERDKPIPVAERSKEWVCSRSPAEIVGSNFAGGMNIVCFECCVLSGRGLCDGLITRPEESYRLWCVLVCDLEISKMRRLKPASGL